MHHHPCHGHVASGPARPCAPPPHAGLAGVAGGVINLATSLLFGGAQIVRTLVEGSVWQDVPTHHRGCCCGGCVQHVYHVSCVPGTCSCSCCRCC